MTPDSDNTQADLPQSVIRFVKKKAAIFTKAWVAGDPPSLEEHIKTTREKLQPHVFRALLEIDCDKRREHGLAPRRDEYLRRFPEFHEVIESIAGADESPETMNEETALHKGGAKTAPHGETLMGGSAPQTIKTRNAKPGRIGPYEIIRELGRGGMGVVYLAKEQNLDRHVAIKLLRSDGFDSAEERSRFRNEASTLAKVKHPNIVQIYRIGKHKDSLYIVLEYIDGPNLANLLRGNPQPPRQAAEFMEILARAIHAVHEQGVVHRDLKPANVLLSCQLSVASCQNDEEDSARQRNKSKRDRLQPHGTDNRQLTTDNYVPKITDFGLAKALDDDHALTRTGDLLGTPSYMSPEQAIGRRDGIGPSADVYALGAILYEMLTGRPPFKADSLLATLEQVRHQEPVPPSRLQGKLPRDLETICLKCLEKDPRKRYSSARDLAMDLKRFLAGKPIQARPIGMIGRTWRWCRRNPLAAALTAAVALALVCGTAVASVFAVEASNRAKEAERSSAKAKLALEQKSQANAAEKISRDRVEWTLYAHQICWAQRELQNKKTAKAGMILDTCRPNLRHWEFLFLKGWAPTSGVVLHKGEQPIVDAAFSSDNKNVAFALADGVIQMRDLEAGALISELGAKGQPVAGLAFRSGGQQLVTVGVQGTMRLWNADDGKSASEWKLNEGDIRSLAVHPKNDLAAVSTTAGTIQIWNLKTKQLAKSWKAHQGSAEAILFHPRENRLASGGADRLVHIWDASTGALIHTFTGHAGEVRSLAFRHDGRQLASGGTVGDKDKNGQIILWDVIEKKKLFSVANPLGAVESTAFSVDGMRLVTGTSDGSVKFWEMRHGQELLCLSEHAKAVNRVQFSPNGRYVLSASHDHTLKIWDSTPPKASPQTK